MAIEEKMMKIWLPGERPWAEVLGENEDGSRIVRIDNKVAGDYTAAEFSQFLADLFGNGAKPDPLDRRGHSYRFNDVVVVKRVEDATGTVTWQPISVPKH